MTMILTSLTLRYIFTLLQLWLYTMHQQYIKECIYYHRLMVPTV